jgi:transcription-repair coupling factor (superfamily II helicase)
MAAYRQLAAARTVEDGRAVIEALRDRYGPLPEPAQHLATIIGLRALARRAGVASISQARGAVVLRLANPMTTGERMRALPAAAARRIELTPEGMLMHTGGGFAETAGHLTDILNALATAGEAPVRAGESVLAPAQR